MIATYESYEKTAQLIASHCRARLTMHMWAEARSSPVYRALYTLFDDRMNIPVCGFARAA